MPGSHPTTSRLFGANTRLKALPCGRMKEAAKSRKNRKEIRRDEQNLEA